MKMYVMMIFKTFCYPIIIKRSIFRCSSNTNLNNNGLVWYDLPRKEVPANNNNTSYYTRNTIKRILDLPPTSKDNPIILIILIIIITKLLLRQYSRKLSSSVAHLVHGLDKLKVQIQCKIHQQMIRGSRNLERITKSKR